MSTIGTGIAAGVANAGQAAKTQTAHQSGRDAQRASAMSQTDKITLTQLHGAGATRDADQEMPEQQAPGYENLYGEEQAQPSEEESVNPNDQIHHADAPGTSQSGVPLQPSYAPGIGPGIGPGIAHGIEPGTADHPLFHAIDLKA